MVIIDRRGLSESLEEFAKRLHVRPADARLDWREDGLRALGLNPSRAVEDGMRIAPGLAVPTRPVFAGQQ